MCTGGFTAEPHYHGKALSDIPTQTAPSWGPHPAPEDGRWTQAHLLNPFHVPSLEKTSGPRRAVSQFSLTPSRDWAEGRFCPSTRLEWRLPAHPGERPAVLASPWSREQPLCRQAGAAFAEGGSRQALFPREWASGGLLIFVLTFFFLKFYFLNEQKAACNSLQLTAAPLQPGGLATRWGRDFVQSRTV